MRKYIFATIIFLFSLFLLQPLTVSAAWNDVQLTADTNLYIPDWRMTLIAGSGAKVTSLTVNAGNIVITGAYDNASDKSSITLTSNERYDFSNTWVLPMTTCDASSSTLTITWTATSSASITVTPTGGICGLGGGGGGGGGGPAVVSTVPTTTTGEITVTPADGGKTVLTTDTGVKATVEVPPGTVSAETVFEVAPAEIGTLAVIAPTPTGEILVTAFNLTATAGTTTLTNFTKSITVSITYTDSQITGLDESTLKIYRWDGTQWVPLSSTVNAATNTVTATTTAFSYFGVMGESAKPVTQMTIDELKAEIVRITVLISQLQAQLNQLAGVPTITDCATSSFNRNLQLGMTGADVKCLQIFLNRDSATQVAVSGAGSPGKETTLFGALTKAAVIKFQENYASEILIPLGLEKGTGYFGFSSRQKANQLIPK
jgi:hypothetical protein